MNEISFWPPDDLRLRDSVFRRGFGKYRMLLLCILPKNAIAIQGNFITSFS